MNTQKDTIEIDSQTKTTTTARPHSEEYFGEYRNHWWNQDYVQLLATRWGVEKVKKVLDVGCGVGHWGRVLLPILPSDATIHGVDREEQHITNAAKNASRDHLSERLSYSVASVEQLPFPDNTFDLVTCQTVLIHVADISKAIQEMMRLLKPGGLLVAAEPNNAANNLVEDSLSVDRPIEQKLRAIEFALTCEKGKAALGEGFNSAGDLIPGLFVQAELEDVKVFLNDKALPLFPPYSSPEQRAYAEQILNWADSGFCGFDKEDARRYFLAGGGSAARFEELWNMDTKEDFQRSAQGLRSHNLHGAGGVVFYVVSGRKKYRD